MMNLLVLALVVASAIPCSRSNGVVDRVDVEVYMSELAGHEAVCGEGAFGRGPGEVFVFGGFGRIAELSAEEKAWLHGFVVEACAFSEERQEYSIGYSADKLEVFALKRLAWMMGVEVRAADADRGTVVVAVGRGASGDRVSAYQSVVEQLSSASRLEERPLRRRVEADSLRLLKQLSDEVVVRLRSLPTISLYSLATVLAADSRAPVVCPGVLAPSDADADVVSGVNAFYAARRVDVEIEAFSSAGPFYVRWGVPGRNGGRLSVSVHDGEVAGAHTVVLLDESLRNHGWLLRAEGALYDLLDAEAVSLLSLGRGGCVIIGRCTAVTRVRDLLRSCFDAQRPSEVRDACSRYMRMLEREVP